MSSNLTAATATNLGTLPATVTQDVNDATAPNYYVWFKYTAQEGEVAIGWWAHAPEASNLNPWTDIFQGSPDSLTAHPLNSDFFSKRGALQIPVDPGTTYYFRVGHIDEGDAAAPFTASLTISALPAPNEGTIPVGSILIPDDSEGFPLAVLSGTTGEVIKFIEFPSGELGEVMPDGTMMVENGTGTPSLTRIYRPDFTVLADVDSAHFAGVVNHGQYSSDRDDRFYIAFKGLATNVNGAMALSTSGALLGKWFFGGVGLTGGAPARDNTIFYYTGSGGASNAPIKRWDLVSNVALPDLAAGVPSYTSRDILVLYDGTVLASYNGAASFVRRYSAAGLVLQDYSIPEGIDHIAHDPTEDAFWVWSQPFDTTRHFVFRKIDFETGTVLTEFNSVCFELGACEPLDGQDYSTDAPAGRFGASFSCPLLITHVATSDEREPPTVDQPEDCPCPPPDGGSAPPPSGSGTPPPTGTGPIGGGGFGKSGTNEGGIGWTPMCTGGGTVGSYAVADPGESMVGVREPRIWTEIAFQSFAGDTPTAATEYWSQDVSIPDKPGIYGGRKDGRLFSIGKIARSISDDNGHYQGTKVAVHLNDKDRASLRTRLGSASTKYVWEREAVIRLASEGNRRSLYNRPPRELVRGLTRDIALAGKFTGSISIEDRICSQFGQFGPDRSFSSRLLTTGLLPGCPRELVGKPQQWIFGEVSDEGATDISTGAPASKGLVPIWLVGSLGSEDEYHLAAHALAADIRLYGSDGATPPTRVLLSTSAYRVETMDLTDSETGDVHRVTHVFLPSDSVPSVAHKSGQLTMAANVCGVEDVGDGSGELITDLFKIYQFIFEHIVLPTTEYHTGTYPGSPQWADGRYMVHSESFETAQDFSITRIGGSGYQGGFVLGGPARGAVPLRELLKRMSNSGDCWFTWSHAGQLKVVLLDDATSLEDATLYSEPADLRDMPTPSFEFDEVENPVLFSYDWDDDKQKPRVAQESVVDALAATRMGRERPSPTPISMRCIRDEATAFDVARRRLLRRKYPPGYYPVVLPIDGVDVEPGDVITITSQEGVGSGSTARGLFVRDWTFEPRTMRTHLYCRDMTDLLESAFLWSSDSVTTWDGSSASVRADNGFWANDDDEIPTGSNDGKGWR